MTRLDQSILPTVRSVAISTGLHSLILVLVLHAPRTAPTADYPQREVEVFLRDVEALELQEIAEFQMQPWEPPDMAMEPFEEFIMEPAPSELAYDLNPLQSDPFADSQPLVDSLPSETERHIDSVAQTFWMKIRARLERELLRLRPIDGSTSITVRILALEDKLIPLAPPTESEDPRVRWVREAVERVVLAAASPPVQAAGTKIRIDVRVE
ncbi:MAG: hypothetical protein NZ740_08610 [Kiritimatiellae bacterium]|nr:hypothetical protein [Kiritimatiellia bacterium]MDW8459154.1 hypothetical protein [Verrucomicrobiota bacterium]